MTIILNLLDLIQYGLNYKNYMQTRCRDYINGRDEKGGAYKALFSDFDLYYPLLFKLLKAIHLYLV